MATTSSNPTAGAAIMGQGTYGKGHKGRAAGLVASAALGLGLLAGGIIGHARATDAPGASPASASPPPVVIALGDRDDPRFAGPVISRSTIADGSQPGLLEVMPGESRIVAGLPPTRVKAGDLDGPRFLEQNTHFPALASVVDPRIWTGSCRPGGDGCQPDEDYTATAPVVARPQAYSGPCRPGGSDCIPDEEIVVPAPGAASPRVYSGPCRAGSSDCTPEEDILAVAPSQPAVATSTSCLYASAAGVPGEGCATTPTAFTPGPSTFRWEQVERRQVAPMPPLVIMGETPCPLGGTAPCGLASTFGVAPVQPPVITGETPCPLGGTAPCDLAGTVGLAGGTLSGGSYEDLVWELDQAIWELGQAAQAATVGTNNRALYDGTSPGLMETNVGEVPSRAVVASLPTYRESHGLDIAPAFAPDQFTYREDRRAGTPALVASLLLDPTRCDCFA